MIAGPAEPFLLDERVTEKLGYATELAVVVGRRRRHARADGALEAVFGHIVMNDLSARDRQIKGGGRMALGPGKNFDGATRLEQWVVTADDVPDPQALDFGACEWRPSAVERHRSGCGVPSGRSCLSLPLSAGTGRQDEHTCPRLTWRRRRRVHRRRRRCRSRRFRCRTRRVRCRRGRR